MLDAEQRRSDEGFMREAMAEAALAEAAGDVPVGAVVVVDGAIVSRGHNRREALNDPTSHAEVEAIRQASAALQSWRLPSATVYVTLEPCPMCAGAMLAARVERVVFGATDPKAGACGTLYNLCADPRLNHEIALTSGVLEAECATQLRTFFASLR
jgi:tRNA(adenine34) deaminase